jgi:hypothetical protein
VSSQGGQYREKNFSGKNLEKGPYPIFEKKISGNFSKIQPIMNTKGKSQYNMREGVNITLGFTN